MDREIFSKESRTGSMRNALMEEGGDIAEIFAKMTPEEKAHGRLVGKILEAHGNEAIEDAFKWFEQEHNKGVQLSYRMKMLAIFQAAETLGCDQQQYNLIRKMYLVVNNR